MRDQLALFVREALLRGVDRQEVRQVLLNAKWPEDEVDAALDAYVDAQFPVPIPRPQAYVSARDAFGYLVLFSTLYVSAVAFVQLIYQFINLGFPDAADAYWRVESSLRSIRWSTASLLLSFPVFLWLSRSNYRAARDDPEKRTSKIRKWLTYLTLFIAATVLMSDGVTLLYFFLGGDVTVRFLLKVLTVAAVGGAAFGYYLWDLRQDDAKPDERERPAWLPGFVGTLVASYLVSIVAGFFLVGSPVQARLERIDDRRVADLELVSDGIDSYWRRHQLLPESLDELANEREFDYGERIRDPETGLLYEYSAGAGRAYELCATFALESAKQRAGVSDFWGHDSGRVCFQLEANDD